MVLKILHVFAWVSSWMQNSISGRRLGLPPGCRLLISLPLSLTFYYYSAWKVILILPKGRRLSRPRHCSKGVQPMPKAVCHSVCCDKYTAVHAGIWWSVLSLSVVVCTAKLPLHYSSTYFAVCILPAFCKNPVNDKWYSYNDEKVEELNGDSAIVTNAAYLLFYRRQFSTTDHCEISLSRWIEAILAATYTDLEISDPRPTKEMTRATNGMCCLLTIFSLQGKVGPIQVGFRKTRVF